MPIAYPHRRADVIAALTTLAAAPPDVSWHQEDPRWPDLTDAIHWLVDDTWWDGRDLREDIGLTLRDEQEAAAVRAVLEPLLELLDRLGPHARDRAYFTDRSWTTVQEAAAAAMTLLTANRS